MPGKVEKLTLTPCSHNISVNWTKPILNSYCVTHYDVSWVHTSSESKDNMTVSSEEDSYVIEGLDACVKYEVSVRAMNEDDESTDAETGNTRTETDGNYHTQIILSYL